MTRQEQLAKTAKDLILAEPFYGMFLIMLNKVWRKTVPTAGVSLNGINYQLAINEEFWDSLPMIQHRGLLKHELLHIGFMHITDFNHLSDKKLANVAMDLEINQYIDKSWLPPGGMHLDTFPELNLEPKKGTKYYYDKLQQGKKDRNCPNLNDLLKGMGQGQIVIKLGNGQDDINAPDHSTWEEFEDLDEATKTLIKAQTEHILKEVADQITKSRGTVPGEFAEILDRINHVEPPKFDWKGYLRRFAGGSTKIYTKKTRRKYNKRYTDSPGLKIKPRRHILVAIDTSGSVSTNELNEFMHEIGHIHKTGTEVTILQADSAISHIAPYKKNQEMKIYGRGGTSFQPAVDHYRENNHKYTAMVYFTDGEAPAPENVRGKLLWVLSSRSHDNPELPGFVIKLN